MRAVSFATDAATKAYVDAIPQLAYFNAASYVADATILANTPTTLNVYDLNTSKVTGTIEFLERSAYRFGPFFVIYLSINRSSVSMENAYYASFQNFMTKIGNVLGTACGSAGMAKEFVPYVSVRSNNGYPVTVSIGLYSVKCPYSGTGGSFDWTIWGIAK